MILGRVKYRGRSDAAFFILLTSQSSGGGLQIQSNGFSYVVSDDADRRHFRFRRYFIWNQIVKQQNRH